MYADFNYYSNSFPEPAIPENLREKYLKRADVFMTSLFLDGAPSEPYGDNLKDACCAVAECFYGFAKREGISSESNDGYSVSFTSEGFQNAEKKAFSIVKQYLCGTNLLFRGAMR